MHWAKRQFAFADYAPYQSKLQTLLMANARRHREFMMVATDTREAGVSTYFVGVPEKAFLAGLDGFTAIDEAELPKEIDTLLVADGTSEEFKSRFRFRKK
jgi:N-acetylglutamate synthase-like GNAT family acetyltransferase